jgi:MYXO-CTERM domain-containing protein
MKRQAQVDLDGALDSTIVAHEWGHVLSNRLVNDANGLNTNQSGGLGEGWGDFVALLLAARDDDPFGAAGKNWSGAYPLAGYAMSGSGADYYFGIRRVPYSVELTKDPLTFKHIESGVALPTTAPISFGEDGSTNSEVHSTGEVWATMLWECYVSLLRDGRYTFKQAQDRMKRYLVGGLKLTPPDPTLLEARDAMLAAAFASDEKDFRGFFEAFARRGAGVGAEGPPKDSGNNSGVKESYLVGNDVQVLKATITDDVISCDHDGILDDGEVGTIEIHLRNAGVGPLTETKLKVSSPVPMLFPEGDTTQVGTLKPFDSTKVKIRVSLATAPAGKPLSIDVAVDDPSLALPRTIHVPIATHFDSDQSDAADNVDHVDTTGTSWTAAGSGGKKWSRTTTTGDGWWTVPDQPEPADQKLTSAPFTVDGTQFTLQFRHRWSFRRSTRRNVDVDGGLIEISTDGGKLWKDISEVAKPDYNTKIDTGGFGDNPLKGRPAYGNKSPGYPAQWVTSSLDVTLPSKPDQVQIRFRAGSGTGFAGAPGWEIDDIALLGISSKPFWGYLPHADACDPDGPTADAGQPKTVLARTLATLQGSGTHPKGLPINFVWSQAGGQPVELRGPATPTVSFDAPDTRENKTLTFVLRTNDGARLSPASKVDVTVVRNGPPVEQFSIGGGCSQSPSSAGWAAPLLGALAFLVARRRKKS